MEAREAPSLPSLLSGERRETAPCIGLDLGSGGRKRRRRAERIWRSRTRRVYTGKLYSVLHFTPPSPPSQVHTTSRFQRAAGTSILDKHTAWSLPRPPLARGCPGVLALEGLPPTACSQELGLGILGFSSLVLQLPVGKFATPCLSGTSGAHRGVCCTGRGHLQRQGIKTSFEDRELQPIHHTDQNPWGGWVWLRLPREPHHPRKRLGGRAGRRGTRSQHLNSWGNFQGRPVLPGCERLASDLSCLHEGLLYFRPGSLMGQC